MENIENKNDIYEDIEGEATLDSSKDLKPENVYSLADIRKAKQLDFKIMVG